jgi:ATP-dependent DNA helicase RecQ
MSTALAPQNLTDALHESFGFREFRPLQEEAVGAAQDGSDVLVVMPTGAGKSLCFQLPAMLTPGVTLVVSPLVALMKDQVDALNRRPAFAALGSACLSSLQTADEQRGVLAGLRAGRIRLIYVAPERFRSGAFVEALRSVGVARLVVDEAHCISEWGHDFRPDYLTLQTVAETLGRPPITAVTATATRRVQQSIVANLGMRDPLVLVGGFDRPNLHYGVVRCKTETERGERLARALPKLAAQPGSGLIYVATRKQCEEIFHTASEALAPVGKRVGMYHAGLDAEERNAMQQRWLDGELHTLVATNAFGMGIDKPDVRFVIHCACPDSLESYYQEAGRAGRDGKKSRCVILYHFTDRRTREWFIDNEALTPEGDSVTVSKFGMARLLGPNDKGNGLTLRLALGELERADLIQRLGETPDEITLRLLQHDFPADAIRRIRTDLDNQRKERYRRLDEMTDYCKTLDCRRRTVLDYFGDRQEPEDTGFCCDNCDHPERAEKARATSQPVRGPAVAPLPSSIAPHDIHGILQGIDALRFPLGRARLNKVLRGASAKGTEQFGRHPLFGVLKGSSVDSVDTFLNDLIGQGYMRQADEDEYFVCAVTQSGRDAWQERSELAIVVPGQPRVKAKTPRTFHGDDTPADNDAPMDEAVFDALRAWRTGEASALSQPPYCVFSDKTLREIARQQPQTLSDLRRVSGVGDAKLEKFGDAIMEILSRSAQD